MNFLGRITCRRNAISDRKTGQIVASWKKSGQTFNDDSLQLWPIVAVSSGVASIQNPLVDRRKTIAAYLCEVILSTFAVYLIKIEAIL